MTPFERVYAFCKRVRQGGCSYREANELLLIENKGVEAFTGVDEAEVLRTTSTIIAARPKASQTHCDEIHHLPTPAEFLREYVAKSRPVIMRGLVKHWAAVSTKPWSMDYLVQKAGNSTVNIYVSVVPEFEYATTMREYKQQVAGKVRKEILEHTLETSSTSTSTSSTTAAIGASGDTTSTTTSSEDDDDEIILVRPAEIQMKFKEYAYLSSPQYPNTEQAYFYFQKHTLYQWAKYGLLEDLIPSLFDDGDSKEGPIGTKRPKSKSKRRKLEKQQKDFAFARFLYLKHHFLWMGRNYSHGNMHYDAFENLLGAIRGKKRFELYHPFHEGMYERDATFRTGHLLYSWDREGYELKSDKERRLHGGPAPGRKGRGRFWNIPVSMTTKTSQPFSPVNTTHPDKERHPLFGTTGTYTMYCLYLVYTYVYH